MSSGSGDHGFIRVSRIPVSSWNAWNAQKTGQSAAASSDISFDVLESERWRERERERKKRSGKHMDGKTDKGKLKYMRSGMCAKQRRAALKNRAVKNSV